MATIKIIKKSDKVLKVETKQENKPTIESTIKGWVMETKANKQAQTETARKFWGLN